MIEIRDHQSNALLATAPNYAAAYRVATIANWEVTRHAYHPGNATEGHLMVKTLDQQKSYIIWCNQHGYFTGFDSGDEFELDVPSFGRDISGALKCNRRLGSEELALDLAHLCPHTTFYVQESDTHKVKFTVQWNN